MKPSAVAVIFVVISLLCTPSFLTNVFLAVAASSNENVATTGIESPMVSAPDPLLTYTVTQYHLPNGSAQPWGIAVDGSGKVWFVEEQSNQIGMFDPKTRAFHEYKVPTPNSLLEEISVDSSGKVWFTELNAQQLGELDPTNGGIREYKIPSGSNGIPCGPIGVTAQSASSVWLTCEFSDQIDQFYPTNSSFSSYDLPIFYSAPLEIVFDSTGKTFWFTAADSNMIGHVVLSQLVTGSSEGIQEFAPTNSTYLTTITNSQLPTQIQNEPGAGNNGSQTIVSSLRTPSQLAISPDGKTLWITEHVVSSFDEYNIETKSLDKFWTSQTHNPDYTTSLPNGIVVDNNGNVWIAEHYGNKIAEFDPETQELVEYPIPCCGTEQIAGSLYLALGQNSTVWFTEFFGNAIGELSPLSLSSSYSSSGALNISVGLNSTAVSLQGTGGSASVPVDVKSNSVYAGSNASDVSFDISGISGTGILQNSTAVFSPSTLIITPGQTKSTNLQISTNGLKSGIYYLTVSAKYAATGVIYSTILKLAISSSSTSIYRSQLVMAAVIGVVASIVVVGSIAVISKKRPKVKFVRRQRSG